MATYFHLIEPQKSVYGVIPRSTKGCKIHVNEVVQCDPTFSNCSY